ncbi:helix-turn-helix transcriptional regulator [Phenylobacterium sp.]|uniref:helix-turn-helix transcriptional regulator n=1 Tax=Phenylobacterium sp. TaxID=1871053 RepID=UPI0035269C21
MAGSDHPESASHTSIRSLEEGFRRFKDVSPMVSLRAVRLEKARAELRRLGSQANIGEVARSCGFPHVGRFATDYRRAFGELPSATKASGAAPSGVAPSARGP